MKHIVRSFLVFALTLGGTSAVFADGPFQFYSLTPCRVVDTRNAVSTNGGPAMGGSATRNFQVQGTCGVPVGAKAVSLNVTITGPTADSHLRLWPSGTTMPNVSTINFVAGETAIANGAIVPLSSAAQDLSVFNFGGSVHVIIDVTGYFQ